ncbi:MAG: hypothetical protein AAF512_26565, partial [Pseudomonadota bacterium]
MLTACQQDSLPRNFTEAEFPKQLSDWGSVLIKNRQLIVNKGVVAYDLNTPLFTDYAHKLRTIWVPEGQVGSYDAKQDIELPVGSVVTKTFYYPKQDGQLLKTSSEAEAYTRAGLDLSKVHLIETRVMVRLESGWQGLPYIWNTEQSDAVLEITGAVMHFELNSNEEAEQINYIVPDF